MNVLNDFEASLFKLRNEKRQRCDSLHGFSRIHQCVMKSVPLEVPMDDDAAFHHKVDSYLENRLSVSGTAHSCSVLDQISDRLLHSAQLKRSLAEAEPEKKKGRPPSSSSSSSSSPIPPNFLAKKSFDRNRRPIVSAEAFAGNAAAYSAFTLRPLLEDDWATTRELLVLAQDRQQIVQTRCKSVHELPLDENQVALLVHKELLAKLVHELRTATDRGSALLARKS